jgi:hypothetical protein
MDVPKAHARTFRDVEICGNGARASSATLTPPQWRALQRLLPRAETEMHARIEEREPLWHQLAKCIAEADEARKLELREDGEGGAAFDADVMARLKDLVARYARLVTGDA